MMAALLTHINEEKATEITMMKWRYGLLAKAV
jgi:hypothetical protein